VHPFKAVVGHTLGASSALESVAALSAMRRGVLPASIGDGEVDPEAAVRLLRQNTAGTPRHCLKLSAAFGGANVALVVSTVCGPGAPISASGVELVSLGDARHAADAAALGGRTRLPQVQLSRLDPLSAAAVAATESALARAGAAVIPEKTGVVVGTATATLENDEAFDRRRREKGAGGVEPRRFPPTSPNLPPGQCAIAFGLLGPSLSVGGGPEAPLEALLVAIDLLASGDADAMIVVAAEQVGDVVRELWGQAGWPVPADGGVAAVLRRSEAGTLSRDRVRALLGAVRAGHGAAFGVEPGWPVLAAALGTLEAVGGAGSGG
jgi:3-oxoacyl-[acyl-carrier-protein] synthase II